MLLSLMVADLFAFTIAVNDHQLVDIPQSQASYPYLALHTLGWKAFQDLCAQTIEEVLGLPVSTYREAQDGGQDAVFIIGKDADRDGTVQCKFTSAPGRRLKLSDLTREETSISDLLRGGQADTYVLMTNMGVDAPVAVAVRNRLRELGVKKAHVFGAEFLTRVIRRSARLRALVPRVYGLGDLATILDERRAMQTRALLGHLVETLRVYVPTQSHRAAVRALAEHKVVLLLGEPATGKSTIAAILATTMQEAEGHQSFKCEGPLDLINKWNPHETNRFYWVDDAFGPTQLRTDYVDTWISIMGSVQAAITAGNRFVLTSRRHIYEGAKIRLGSRNHPLFKTSKAVVDVGILSSEERKQILYNHLKAGNQNRSWKKSIKPFLDEVAAEKVFIPEIARRLGDSNYTRHIGTSRVALLSFVREPKTHLIEIIEELARVHQAGLALVYINRGKLMLDDQDGVTWNLVAKSYGVDEVSLGEALQELDQSFIVKAEDNTKSWWTFKHPTIVDAISEIMARNAKLTELYVRGAHWRDLVAEALCAGCRPIKDAIVVPDEQVGILATRLSEIPSEPDANMALFRFLEARASDQCLGLVLDSEPGLFDRGHSYYFRLAYDPKLAVMVRAAAAGRLDERHREAVVKRIRDRIFYSLDVSIFDDEDILGLLRPKELIRLVVELRTFVGELTSVAESIEEDAAPDADASDVFDDYRSAITHFGVLFEGDDDTIRELSAAERTMVDAIERLQQREPPPEREWELDDVEPDTPSEDHSERSIFSDVEL